MNGCCAAALVVDPVDADGSIAKIFLRDGSESHRVGDYKLLLRVERRGHHGHGALALVVDVAEGIPEFFMGQFRPVRDLQAWLGMVGHAILVSEAGDRVEDKVFGHLHSGHHGGGHPHATHDHGGGHTPRAPAAGPRLEFVVDLPVSVPAGVYKLWVQVKLRGQALTFPFVVRL